MYTFDNATLPITLEEIENKVSDLEIFKKYCSNFNKLDTDFLSEFYDDNRPSCRIFNKGNGKLAYKDFGTGEYYTSIDYIKRKYNCTFVEALNIIANDFNISKIKLDIKPSTLILNDIVIASNFKSKIEIISQPFTITDYNYWISHKIPLSLLQEYNVFSCSHVFLHKSDKIVTFEYNKANPIYAYRFCWEGEYYYKIYKPLEINRKYKWLFSGTKECIEGEDQLPLHGDLLILTKSLKDCMAYNLIGLPAISLQGEANRIERGMLDRVLKRFKRVVVNYDNDVEGQRGANRIMQQMGFKSFIIDLPFKDLSEYMKQNTIEQAKIMINNKLNDINRSN